MGNAQSGLERFSLSGRNVLITGATGRVGRIISAALSSAGAHVLLGSRRFPDARTMAAQFRNEGAEASPVSIDPTSKKSASSAAERIVREYGRLDVLFNNAVAVSAGDLRAYQREDWTRVMRCNSTGLFIMCQIFGSLMEEQGFGTIVNVGSVYGIVSPSFEIYRGFEKLTSSPSYAFAKGGMIQLTRYLATFLGPRGVTVNCLSIGGVRTNEVSRKFARRYGRKTALGRMANAEDIGPVAVFLAGAGARYITGQNIVVDGGYTAA